MKDIYCKCRTLSLRARAMKESDLEITSQLKRQFAPGFEKASGTPRLLNDDELPMCPINSQPSQKLALL
jgi:hypothetical protein